MRVFKSSRKTEDLLRASLLATARVRDNYLEVIGDPDRTPANVRAAKAKMLESINDLEFFLADAKKRLLPRIDEPAPA